MSVVIIPAYKPDKTIVGIVDKLWTCGHQVLVVDDGSGMEYQGIFEQIEDICIVLHHEKNQGKGAAIKTALAYIQKEMHVQTVIGIMDCDGQHLPEDMMKLLDYAKNHQRSLVLGCRKVGKEMPLKSRLGNKITRAVFYQASGVWISDTQTGLRAFSSNLVSTLQMVKGERYEYETNVLLVLAKMGIPFEEVPIHTIYKNQENSTSHFRAVRDSVRIYKDILKFTLSSFSSFVLDYLLFSFLMILFPHTPLWVLGANIFARMFSAFYNYSMNCRFVFHTHKKGKTALEYFGLAVFILCINNVILEFLIQVAGFLVYPAKLCTECLLFCISWLVQNFIIFRKKTDTQLYGKRQMRA